jgi:hypothetical protein
VGRWERLARMIHETYIAAYPDPSDDARQPWAELSSFYKESNMRQVMSVVGTAVTLGRRWESGPADPTPVTDEMLDAMARSDHESWFHFMRSNGWRWGSSRDRRRLRHPDLLPWEDLAEESREKTRKGVGDVLAQLGALGYYANLDPTTAWVHFHRHGEVTAVRRDEPWTWTTSDGAPMHGRAGDWEVTDDGGSRSVDAAIFEETHEPIEGDRWRRTGEVRGRQARPGELVHSLEGDQTARPGQWVMRGVAGEEWLVSAEHLDSTYDRVDAD